MAKKTLSELGQRFKKLALTSKQYTDDKVSALENAQTLKLLTPATATEGYMKTYVLATGANAALDATGAVTGTGAQLIGKIDIPKDFLVKDSKLLKVESLEGTLTVTAEDGTALAEDKRYAAPTGITAAGQWIDLVVNTKADGDGKTEEDKHLCINVTTLFDDYFSGNDAIGITDHKVSLVLGDNTNGLSVVDGKGLELALATQTKAGAQSADDKKLEDEVRSDLSLMTTGEIISWFGYDPAKVTEADTSEKELADAFAAADFADSLTDAE